MAGASGRGGQFHKAAFEAQGRQLAPKDLGHLAHAGEIFRRTVDHDGFLQVTGKVLAAGINARDDFLLLRREGEGK